MTSSGSTLGALDETIRALVRDVVREELKVALSGHATATLQRNGRHDDGYFSIARAAIFADVAPGTLRRWIRSGRLPVRRAGRVYRIARAELEDFLRRSGRSADVAARARAIVGGAP
jgi:excisionase family DNA binding protein